MSDSFSSLKKLIEEEEEFDLHNIDSGKRMNNLRKMFYKVPEIRVHNVVEAAVAPKEERALEDKQGVEEKKEEKLLVDGEEDPLDEGSESEYGSSSEDDSSYGGSSSVSGEYQDEFREKESRFDAGGQKSSTRQPQHRFGDGKPAVATSSRQKTDRDEVRKAGRDGQGSQLRLPKESRSRPRRGREEDFEAQPKKDKKSHLT